MKKLIRYIRQLFSLTQDSIEPQEVIREIEAGVHFRGKTLWILMLAILMASLGLNVNSTAVIIGAMLISPLMGPIMGMGLGLGIFNITLLKLAARNFLIAVVISILTSTLYFVVSPTYGNPSELLARTTPTVWDVMIALFGGLAGIVAINSRSNRGNVIPGVAIATALMPPLCTAGYGLAHGNLYFFLGAFYLFIINSVFICLATYIIVRLLKFPFQTDPDKRKQARIRHLITLIATLTIIPSILIAYRMVSKDIYEQYAGKFIRNEIVFPGTVILSSKTDYQRKTITVSLFGRRVSDAELDEARTRLSNYSLNETVLEVDQELSDSVLDASGMRKQFQMISQQDELIRALVTRIDSLSGRIDSLEIKNTKKR